MKNKKIIIIGITLLLLLVVGSAYAFFTYENGTKSDIVTGQIYMNYEETNTISLTNVFPETKEQALARQDENGVFEFTITGRNTSKYPVYYEIDLLEGGVMTGKTEQSTKILPEHVRIYLERDGEPLVDGMTYKDWNNRRIYVDTVPANQTSNIEHKYTLRMWIDENVTISDTDPNADYTTTEWNDAYTSLKVRVVGDFEYKEVATDASCFAYNVIIPDGYVAYDYPIITLDTSEEKVNTCVSYLTTLWGAEEEGNTIDVGETYEAFCNGTGTNRGWTWKEFILYEFFTDEQIQSLGVVESYEIETRYYELNTSEESVNACKEYMLNLTGDYDASDAQDGYQSYCEGTGTIYAGYSIFDDINNGDVSIDYLIENNILTQIEAGELPQVIEITNYDETCGTDVIIPSTIEGLPVTRIADNNEYSEYSGVFQSKSITSVKFPTTLEYIGTNAFYYNSLIEVIIPDSVTIIGKNAFGYNVIENIEIGTGITKIEENAFMHSSGNVIIESNPVLSKYSFYGSYDTFQYGGTCEELNQYKNIFAAGDIPQIITTDNNSCYHSDFMPT